MKREKKLRGLQAQLSRATGIPQSSMSLIFRGERRATAEQALLLEGELIARGYSVTRIDILYSKPGTALLDCRAERRLP